MDDEARPIAQALAAGVALADRSDRLRLVVRGPDRAKFLHNLTTNDVKRLAPGAGCEAFVTTLQGRTLAFVTLHADDDAISVRSDPGAWEALRPHFEKYGLFDDVQFDDATLATFELHLVGPRAAALLEGLEVALPDPGDLAQRAANLAGIGVRVVRERPLGIEGFTLIGDRARASEVLAALRTHAGPEGLRDLSRDDVEGLRIEAATPRSGADVTDAHLPQEFGRDRAAISFTKGCYLGQETVARLDALGHVNRRLAVLRVADDVPVPPGTPLQAGDKPIGAISSIGRSPIGGRVVALGMVRVAQAIPGTQLVADHEGRAVPVEVISVPG
jgi:folate-binding protein YgfZ